MNSDELYDLFRKDVFDTVEPYLFSDEEVFAYMNDAYFMFVRLTGGISDFTSTATDIVTVADDKFSAIDPSVLLVRTATLVETGEIVRVINAQEINNLTDEDYGILTYINTSTRSGKPRYMVIGMQPGLVQWVDIPDQIYNVKLLIERLPLEQIVGGGQEFADVDAVHHYHFLKWMRSLAYRKQDTDVFDPAQAKQERQDFVEYCEFAEKEKMRYRHKVRVVQYGGI